MPEPAPSPTPPSEMSDRDVDGAEAAARYMIGELYSYTLSTQDTRPWEAMSYRECVFCQGVLDRVADYEAAGHILESGAITIHEITVEKLNPQAYGATLRISQEPSRVWNVDGSPAEDPDAGYEGYLHAVFYQEGDGWFLREAETLDTLPTP